MDFLVEHWLTIVIGVFIPIGIAHWNAKRTERSKAKHVTESKTINVSRIFS